VIAILFLVPERHASVGEVFARTINNSGMFGGSLADHQVLVRSTISAAIWAVTISALAARPPNSTSRKSL